MEKTYFSKDKEDPYSDYFLKEAGKLERAHKLSDEVKDQEHLDKVERSGDRYTEGEKRKEVLQDKIDSMLLENEMENEDLLSISHTHRATVKISYDLKSLIKSDNIYDVEPELVDGSITDEQYLDIQRRRAETKLIKSKILYKLY